MTLADIRERHAKAMELRQLGSLDSRDDDIAWLLRRVEWLEKNLDDAQKNFEDLLTWRLGSW